MSYPYFVTRGRSRVDPGENPIQQSEWERVIAEFGIGLGETGEARIGPALRDVLALEPTGIAVIESPSNEAREMTHRIADGLRARVFGADEPPLTRTGLDRCVEPTSRACQALAAASLDDSARDTLLTLIDPLSSSEDRARALAAIGSWTGARARGAFAVMCYRANDPLNLGPYLFEALRRLAPGNVDLAESAVDDNVLAALRGESFVVPCKTCGGENRLPRFPPPGTRARCGRCREPLLVWGNEKR